MRCKCGEYMVCIKVEYTPNMKIYTWICTVCGDKIKEKVFV